jgi:hypothetical protein
MPHHPRLLVCACVLSPDCVAESDIGGEPDVVVGEERGGTRRSRDAGRRLVILFLLVGCTRTTGFLYTPTNSRTSSMKPDGCEFEILTTPPARAFEEIGVLDLDPKVDYSPSTIPEFRKVAAHHICSHGGDAVIAQANGLGLYIKGTVVRYAAQQPAPITDSPGVQVAPPQPTP